VVDIQITVNCPKDTKLLLNVCNTTNEEVRNVLIWTLGNTLVTSKLDVAMKVGYYDEKRFRVITTNGELIDLSGTITKLSLKSGKDKEDQELLNKKLELMKRLRTSLQ
jgi:chromosome segregation ATPase